MGGQLLEVHILEQPEQHAAKANAQADPEDRVAGEAEAGEMEDRGAYRGQREVCFAGGGGEGMRQEQEERNRQAAHQRVECGVDWFHVTGFRLVVRCARNA